MKTVSMRATQIDLVLQDYSNETDPTTNLIDLLADAMHWCAVNEIEFDEQLRIARMHFDHEDDQPSVDQFDAYEIHGVREYGRGKSCYCEQVADSEAEFFSLYGHIPGQGIECIGDFKTRQLAEEVYARITGKRY